MSKLTHFDPFAIDPVSELFQGFFRPLRAMTPEGAPVAQVKIDVTETDSAYQVTADLPGVDKKDIDVKIDGNVVSIKATVERRTEAKEGERVIRRERSCGAVRRSFSLRGTPTRQMLRRGIRTECSRSRCQKERVRNRSAYKLTELRARGLLRRGDDRGG